LLTGGCDHPVDFHRIDCAMAAASTRVMRIVLATTLLAGSLTFVATRPLTAPKAATVEMGDMTWIEIRDSLRAGMATVLVPSGGIEANGPHMITDKHQHIVRLAARMIAERHGGMLVAPVLSLAPEGDYAPPTGNMQWPGTIGVPPQVFEASLEGVARSLKAAGFKRVVFMADHGQSQPSQAAVAARLTEAWRGDGVAVLALGDYYKEGDAAQQRLLAARGETPATIGDHAGLQDTAELMFAHPAGVRLERLKRPFGVIEPDGSSGRPERATAELGEALIRAKVDAALAQLRRASF
jgi:creatinine amidohydrolase/Fe(II)-dependent formamide hydrolase-like protein